MPTTSPDGIFYPDDTEINDVPDDMQQNANTIQAALIDVRQDSLGIATMTRAARLALAGLDLWDGRVVKDTDWDQWMGWDAGRARWEFIGNEIAVSSGSTSALGATPTLLNTTDIYVGLRVAYRNTADPAEVKHYDVIDTSPVTYLERPWNSGWGFVDGVVATASSAGTATTTPVVLPGCTKSMALRKNRKLQFSYGMLCSSTIAGDVLIVQPYIGGVALAGTGLAAWTAAANNHQWNGAVQAINYTATSGSVTVDLRFSRFTGTGTIQHRSDIVPGFLAVVDLGPAGIPSV